jgi:hypothetical protein
MRLPDCITGATVQITSVPPGHILHGQAAKIMLALPPGHPAILRDPRDVLAWPTGRLTLQLDPSLRVRRWRAEEIYAAPEDVDLPGAAPGRSVTVHLSAAEVGVLSGYISPEDGRVTLADVLETLALTAHGPGGGLE